MSEENKNTTTTEATEPQYFDKRDVYRQEVVPLLEQLNQVCDKHGLPHLFWVIWFNDEKSIGQGVLLHANENFKKMLILGNIAEGNVGLDEVAKVAFMGTLAGALRDMVKGAASSSKEEVAE